MPLPWLLAVGAALLFSGRGAQAQQGNCGFDRLLTADSILATCCESTNATDCSKGFPQKCTLECGKLVVPFYHACSATMKSMHTLFKFSARDMKAYVQNCEHTQELFHHKSGPGECADNSEQKALRVQDVTAACCYQGGKFVCQDEVPWKCNVRPSCFCRFTRPHRSIQCASAS